MTQPTAATDTPTGIHCVIPSRLAVGEPFTVKLKVLGPVRAIPCRGQWNVRKPGLGSPFNLNIERQIQYMDNCLPTWQGTLELDGDGALEAPQTVVFDGKNQGAFPGDVRPIAQRAGCTWTQPGFQFLHLVEPESGLEAWSNPCFVTEEAPTERIYWGDPHWQTFFSDGIRCPEELYAFARDEAFLDFGAISDHMEALTDRQWDYFQAVTNDYNAPGVFATLNGQEWTHHIQEFGAPGHRNVYYRGDGGPAVRCTDPDCNTLEKLWARLDSLPEGEAIAIPHHPANVIMGVRWELGWNPKYETAVEVYSVWGSSEKPASEGNTRPIRNCDGEMDGRHVRDALKRGYRMGFMGGGDIHDGRPGLAMHRESYPKPHFSYDNGLTAVRVPALTREHVFDAMRDKRTYATTCSRIFLEAVPSGTANAPALEVKAASEEGIANVTLVTDTGEKLFPNDNADPRIMERVLPAGDLAPEHFCYARVTTEKGNMAWSTPVWGDEY